MSIYYPDLEKGKQQDAHECLFYILNLFHNATVIKDQSIITNLFYGQYSQKLRCLKCNKKTFTEQVFSDISLQIPDKKELTTVDNLLTDFFKKETVSYKCEKCKNQGNHEKSLKIQKAPKYLIIHLKRFNNDLSKNEKFIGFSSFLSLEENSIKEEEYSLISVINHYGNFTKGHYITLNKTFDGKWVCLDDDISMEIDNLEVCSKEAYILVYELT
jgi:ubiquitin C-terminal hydrolase